MEMDDLINQLRTKTALTRLNDDESHAVFKALDELGYEVVRKGGISRVIVDPK